MNLDRRAKFQAIGLSALAQLLGLVGALAAGAGTVGPANTAQLGVAAIFTVLSSGMALHVASRLQTQRVTEA